MVYGRGNILEEAKVNQTNDLLEEFTWLMTDYPTNHHTQDQDGWQRRSKNIQVDL